MVFESLFGRSKKENLGKARAQQFKEAWLLANRSLLAVKTLNEEEDTQVEEAPLVDKAKQFVQDNKTSFSAESREVEQLTYCLMPIVEEIYSLANRYMNDADVSSAHNTAFQRILELVIETTSKGETFTEIPAPEDFSDNEAALLTRVTQTISNYWKAAESNQ